MEEEREIQFWICEMPVGHPRNVWHPVGIMDLKFMIKMRATTLIWIWLFMRFTVKQMASSVKKKRTLGNTVPELRAKERRTKHKRKTTRVMVTPRPENLES